ncbi:MAG: Wzz/FepE/Etk N-terminal domain-containing protein [Deltaproteobacteria bacterium]|nr:Wzz/FepE/Etk N-terminal domain-containing protein [Deltaproteobacteria bacterium]
MSETTSQVRMYDGENEDEIDLVSLFLVIWKRRKLIVFGTLGVTLLAAIYSFMIPKVYLSTGFYQLGCGMPNSEFKGGSTLFYDPDRLKIFANHEKTFTLWEKINGSFNTSENIKKCIKPMYTHSKEDTREIGNLPSDQKNVVIGVELSYEADLSQKAHDVVSFLGDYMKNCLNYIKVFNYIQDGYNNADSELTKNENAIIANHFQLLQYTNKALDIQAIMKKYPESAKIEDRQLVSIQEGGYHYLSPVTQLVGIESNLADVRRGLADLERAKEKLMLNKEFFSNCMDMMEKADKNGDFLLSQLPIIKNDVFKNKDLNKDATKEVFNNISIEIQNFERIKTNHLFISGPSIPEKPIKPNKRVIVMVTFFASFFLLVMVTFILEWWQKNKEIIRASNRKQMEE